MKQSFGIRMSDMILGFRATYLSILVDSILIAADRRIQSIFRVSLSTRVNSMRGSRTEQEILWGGISSNRQTNLSLSLSSVFVLGRQSARARFHLSDECFFPAWNQQMRHSALVCNCFVSTRLNDLHWQRRFIAWVLQLCSLSLLCGTLHKSNGI